jgi:hypothetical protein
VESTLLARNDEFAGKSHCSSHDCFASSHFELVSCALKELKSTRTTDKELPWQGLHFSQGIYGFKLTTTKASIRVTVHPGAQQSN